MTKKWYFTYDSNTFEYVRAVFAEEQPAYSTAVDPAGVRFAVFDVTSASWKSNQKLLDQFENNNKQLVNPVQSQIATMFQVVSKQNMALSAKMAAQEKMIAAQGKMIEQLQGGAK